MGRKPRCQDGCTSSSSGVAVAAVNADTNYAAAAEELWRAKRSIEIDQVKYYLENDCLRNYMNKTGAAAFLLMEQGGQPAVTEIELERQNPESFRHYKLRLIVKDQIVKFNELLASQSSMMENLQNGVTSGSIPNGDLTCSTSPDASISNSTQGSVFPLSENQSVHAVNISAGPAPVMDNSAIVHHGVNGAFGQNDNVHALMMDNSVRGHHHIMNGAFAQNGDFHAPVMDNSMRVHHGMNGAFVQDGNMCAPGMNMNDPITMHHVMNRAFFPNGTVGVEGMDSSTRILDEMNSAGIYSQATNSAIYNSFDAGMTHLPPLIQNQPIFYCSEETLLDLMEQNQPPSEANNSPFPLAPAMGLDDIFEGVISLRE